MNLFVYGTLLVPEIWTRVTGTDPSGSREAALPGYEIRRVRGEDFPAIFPLPGAGPVPGRVFFDLAEASVRRLDRYEDSFYRRLEVEARVEGLGTIAAQAYVVPPEGSAALLSEEGWTLDWFEREALAGFRRRVFGD